MRYALAILAVSLTACASSPTAPAASVVTPTPTAKLTVKGDLDLEDVGTGWLLHATATNTGDACAADVTGTTTVKSSTASFAYDWSYPPLVKPGESFTYTFGPLVDADALKLGTYATYTTAFRFRTIPC